MKFTEMMMAENLANADRFEPLDIQPDEMLMDAAPVEYGGEQQEMRKSMAEFGMDITPVIGDVKGAYELPDDMRMAKELVEQGYDEGDIVSMGLGGALGSLSMMGLIPFAGTAADVMKKGVKETAKSRLADQMDKGILTKDRGMSYRGRVVPEGQLHRAEFSGEPKEKPTPKVFHGARSMNAPRSQERFRFAATLQKFKTQYIKDPVYDLFTDKESGLISNPIKTVDDIIDEQGYGKFAIPVGEGDGSIDVANVTFKKGKDGALDVHFIDIDKNIVEEEAVASIPPAAHGGIDYDRMLSQLNKISDMVSADPAKMGEKRIDVIKREGFSPYSDFTGESGLAGVSATGEHSELKRKMLSTSRDPLVAMKPGFGGGDTSNIIYADLPPELTRDMSAEEYVKAANLMAGEDRVLPELAEGQIGYRLPKSIHLEAEEAIANPELLNPKALSDNRRLQQKIQRGQDMVDDILKKKDTIYTDVQYPDSAEGVRQMYDRTREVLNKLQSLGQFTEQYGARGTYDDLLESLLDTEKSSDFVDAIQLLPKNLPEGQRKRIATSMRSILNRIGVRGISGAKFKAEEVLSGISDKDLNEALFGTKRVGAKKKRMLDDAGLGIYMDGTLDLERLGYKDLKRLLFLGTQKMNRGGLAARR